MKKINIIISVILLLFCVGYFLMIQSLPDRNLENTLKGSFMPSLLLYIFLLLTLLLLGKNLIFGTIEGCKYQIKKKELFGLIAIVALIYLYVFLMRFGGFLIITPFVIFVLMKLTGSARIREAIIVSITATALIYLLFDVVFNVQLPGGLLM